MFEFHNSLVKKSQIVTSVTAPTQSAWAHSMIIAHFFQSYPSESDNFPLQNKHQHTFGGGICWNSWKRLRVWCSGGHVAPTFGTRFNLFKLYKYNFHSNHIRNWIKAGLNTALRTYLFRWHETVDPISVFKRRKSSHMGHFVRNSKNNSIW